MKENKKNISSGRVPQTQENYPPLFQHDNMVQDGLWMEFEDSFIQVLSGIEPVKKYYSTTDIQQQQIIC